MAWNARCVYTRKRGDGLSSATPQLYHLEKNLYERALYTRMGMRT